MASLVVITGRTMNLIPNRKVMNTEKFPMVAEGTRSGYVAAYDGEYQHTSHHDQTVFDINIFVLCISIGRYRTGEDIRRQGDTHGHIGIHAEESDQHGTDDGSSAHSGETGAQAGSHAGEKR